MCGSLKVAKRTKRFMKIIIIKNAVTKNKHTKARKFVSPTMLHSDLVDIWLSKCIVKSIRTDKYTSVDHNNHIFNMDDVSFAGIWD
jgi:hypothetical protein